MNIYLARDGETIGPFTEAQIKEQLAAGTVSPADLGCPEGEETWKPLSQLVPREGAWPSGETDPAVPLSPDSPGPRSSLATFLLATVGIVVVGAVLVIAWTLFFRGQPPVSPVVVDAAPSPAATGTPLPTPTPEAPTPAPEMVDDPNTPGEKQLAAGPEIARGAQAMGSLPLPPDLDSCEQEISGVFSSNQEKETGSNGFLLGANYGAWKALGKMLSGPNVPKSNDAASTKKAKGLATGYFQEFRSLQNEMNVSDAEFFKAIGNRSPEENAKAVHSLEADEILFSQFVNQ